MVEPGEKFSKQRFLRRLANATLILDFVNTVLYERVMLLILYAKFTESTLSILSYPESTIGPIMHGLWSGPEKNFQNKGSQKVRKYYSEIGFCEYSLS